MFLIMGALIKNYQIFFLNNSLFILVKYDFQAIFKLRLALMK